MNRTFLVAGAIFGLLAVALGAFGAHGLQRVTSDESIIRGFQTGVQYQVYHALVLLITGILSKELPSRLLKTAGACFIIGIILFSGSLYILTWSKIEESGLVKITGPVTPVGGLFFIAGWLSLLGGIFRVDKGKSKRV
jgi:uncharacterized membrane protein YgdD (TMEM256/DUF423 family)